MEVSRPAAPTRANFQNSEHPGGIHRQEDETMLLSGRGTQSDMLGPQRGTELKITAIDLAGDSPPERTKDYKGRIRTWPGILLLLGIIGGACALITLGAIDAREKSQDLARQYEENLNGGRRIKDGVNGSDELIDDDGQVGNPKKYPDMGCELPDYLSKNGQIVARSKNGTEVAVGIKGVNWFGMETGTGIPLGLWENQENGTTTYEIASFLARNKYNSVRLPVCVSSILDDFKPNKNLINLNTNRALNITSYMALVKSVVQVLAYRHVSVMISVHTLTSKTSGGAWYSEELGVSEDDFLDAIDILTSELCSPEYWNVLGLDLKNEPHEATWGGAEPDWQRGATLIGNRMLKGCPNWLAFVEGINSQHPIKTTNRPGVYYDWWGGGLQSALKKPIKLTMENKIVWAPHFYNTGVSPQWYLYKNEDPAAGYVELDDETLRKNVFAIFDDMFGFLAKNKTEAIVLGEFAGLYATDAHPKRTTKRTTDYTLEAALELDIAGGYMWSLNPESAYQFNPADEKGHYVEGLLLDDWLTPNKVFMEGMEPMNKFRDLKMFPCFPVEKS